MDNFLRNAGLRSYITAFHDYGLESIQDLADDTIVNPESLRSQINMTDADIDKFYEALKAEQVRGV